MMSEKQSFDAVQFERLDKIKSDKEAFEQALQDFDEASRQEITSALELMIEMHIDQNDWSDGRPYINHPLQVALYLLRELKIKDRDILIAALLHDSIEDQSKKISELHPRYQSDLVDPEQTRFLASQVLEDKFGMRVTKIIEKLTNPLTEEGISKKEKAERYKQHIKTIIEDPEIFLIKYADFAQNALKTDQIRDPEKKQKLIRKYGPIITDVFLPALQKIDESHPLWQKRDEILAKLQKVYDEQYKPVLETNQDGA